MSEDVAWQRLDKWLWCARFMRQRADCAALVGQGGLRINRQPTDKPHARLRVGDVITLPLRGAVRVVEVLALAARRGPASEAAGLYREIADPGATALDGSQGGAGQDRSGGPCGGTQTTSYPPVSPDP